MENSLPFWILAAKQRGRGAIWIQLAIKSQRGKNKHFFIWFLSQKDSSMVLLAQNALLDEWVAQNVLLRACVYLCVCVCKCEYMCEFVCECPSLCIDPDWCGLSKAMFIFCHNYRESYTRERWRGDGEPDQQRHKGKEIKWVNEKHEIGRERKMKGRSEEGQNILVFLFEVRDSWETQSL